MRTNCKAFLSLLNFFHIIFILAPPYTLSAKLSGLCSVCICFYVWRQARAVTGSLQEIHKSCCQLRAVAPGQEMEFFGTELSEAEWEDWLKLFPALKLNPTMPDSQHWHTGSMERNRSVHLWEQNGADFPKHCNAIRVIHSDIMLPISLDSIESWNSLLWKKKKVQNMGPPVLSSEALTLTLNN